MRRALFVSITVAAAFAALTLARATPAEASHSWGSYHWARTANPFTLTLVDSVTSDWNGYLATARADWTASTVLDLVTAQGNEDSKERKSCVAISGKVRACNQTYGRNGWLGLAHIWVSGNHITQGTTKMNDSYLAADYNTPAWRQFVMCQEVGHNFGLGHQDENFYNPNLGSCMDTTADPDGTINGQLSNLHPNGHDYDQLVTIYAAHLDSTNSFTATAPTGSAGAAADEGGNGPSEWGRAVRSDQHGQPILYLRDLGGGRLVFTWVLPAGSTRGRP